MPQQRALEQASKLGHRMSPFCNNHYDGSVQSECSVCKRTLRVYPKEDEVGDLVLGSALFHHCKELTLA